MAFEGDPSPANIGSMRPCRVKYTPFPFKIKYSPYPLNVNGLFGRKQNKMGPENEIEANLSFVFQLYID